MSDEIVWQIINQGFCSYKIKLNKGQNFCRNEYNVTGLCNRQSCPLANSLYASVRASDKGKICLYIKTAERAHLPSKLWQKIGLSNNYQKALAQIDELLQFHPKFQIHKCKQRLTRLVQVAIREKRLAAESARIGEQLVPKLAPKIRRREETRERKALAAAKLERTIERELLERLRSGTYSEHGTPLNCSEQVWKKILSAMEKEGEAVRDLDPADAEEEDELEEEAEAEDEEDHLDGQVEYISDFEESDEDIDDIEDWLGSEDDDEGDEDDEDGDDSDAELKGKRKAGDKRKRGRVIRMKAKKRREVETEAEVGREKLLAF